MDKSDWPHIRILTVFFLRKECSNICNDDILLHFVVMTVGNLFISIFDGHVLSDVKYSTILSDSTDGR